jgi:hypothetical protein
MSNLVLKANLSPMQSVTKAFSMTVLRPAREAALIKKTRDYSLPQFCRALYAAGRHEQQGELYMPRKSAVY